MLPLPKNRIGSQYILEKTSSDGYKSYFCKLCSVAFDNKDYHLDSNEHYLMHQKKFNPNFNYKRQKCINDTRNNHSTTSTIKENEKIISDRDKYIIEFENGKNKQSTQYFCIVCKLLCHVNDVNAHLKGKRHHANVTINLSYEEVIDTNLKSLLTKEVNKDSNTVAFYLKNELIAYNCIICNYVHPNIDAFSNHLKYCDDFPAINEASLPNKTNIKPLMEIESSKPIICEMCNFDFHSLCEYESHLKDSNHKNLVLESMASECEKILECISDEVAKEELKLSHQNLSNQNLVMSKKRKFTPETVESEIVEQFRRIKGVLRSKQSDDVLKLIIVCSDKPTKVLLDKVYNTFMIKANDPSLQSQFDVSRDNQNDRIFVINKNNSELKCLIFFNLEVMQQVPQIEVKTEPIDDDVIIIEKDEFENENSCKKQRLR